jgi:hypothetical protein
VFLQTAGGAAVTVAMRMSADLIWRLRICMHMRVLLATLLND